MNNKLSAFRLTRFGFRDSGKKLGGKQEYDGESDDDVMLSETLRDLNVTKMNANEEKICQMFQNYGVSVVTGNQPSVFSSGTGITVAKIDRTKHVETPSMKGVHGTPLSSAERVTVQNTDDGQSSVIALDKKTSVFNLPPNDHSSHEVGIQVDDSVGVINKTAVTRDCNHGLCADEQQPPLINEVRNIFMIFESQLSIYLFCFPHSE